MELKTKQLNVREIYVENPSIPWQKFGLCGTRDWNHKSSKRIFFLFKRQREERTTLDFRFFTL